MPVFQIRQVKEGLIKRGEAMKQEKRKRQVCISTFK